MAAHTSSPRSTRAATWAGGVLGVVVSVLCMGWTLRGLDADQIATALHHVSPKHVMLFGVVAGLTQIARVWRWIVQMHGMGETRTGWIASVGALGLSAIFFLPARLGEFVRPVWISRGDTTPLPQAMSTIVAERLVDGAFVGLILLLGGLSARADGALAPDALWRIEAVGLGAGVCFIGALGGLVAACRWRAPLMGAIRRVTRTRIPGVIQRIEEVLERFAQGIETLLQRRTLWRFVLWSVAIWMLNWAGVVIIFDAVGVNLPMHAAWIVLGATALGILVPAAPTSVGTFHFAVVWTLGLYGVENAQAVGTALLMHAGQVASHMMLCGVGALGWMKTRRAQDVG